MNTLEDGIVIRKYSFERFLLIRIFEIKSKSFSCTIGHVNPDYGNMNVDLSGEHLPENTCFQSIFRLTQVLTFQNTGCLM